MRKPEHLEPYRNLVGWLSLPMESALKTDVDRAVHTMSHVALLAVVRTAFSTEGGNRFIMPLHKTDAELFGTPAVVNQYSWDAISADRNTSPRLLGQIARRLHEGVYVYNQGMDSVYQDLGVLPEGLNTPSCAARLYVDQFGLTDTKNEFFIPPDRRVEQYF